MPAHGRGEGRVVGQALAHLLGGRRTGEEESHPASTLGLGEELGLELPSIPQGERVVGGFDRGAADGEPPPVGGERDFHAGPGDVEAEDFLRSAARPRASRCSPKRRRRGGGRRR